MMETDKLFNPLSWNDMIRDRLNVQTREDDLEREWVVSCRMLMAWWK